MIANRLQFLANTRGWLPPNQFGGRQGHSVYDAAQRLLQIVEKAHAEGKVCSVLAVDIQGFFDSVHPQHLHHRLLELRCPSDLADWCQQLQLKILNDCVNRHRPNFQFLC